MHKKFLLRSEGSIRVTSISVPQRDGTTDDDMKIDDGLELVVLLADIGKTDRELYRQLREEAWEMVRRRHGRKTPDQIAQWLRGAS